MQHSKTESKNTTDVMFASPWEADFELGEEGQCNLVSFIRRARDSFFMQYSRLPSQHSYIVVQGGRDSS